MKKHTSAVLKADAHYFISACSKCNYQVKIYEKPTLFKRCYPNLAAGILGKSTAFATLTVTLPFYYNQVQTLSHDVDFAGISNWGCTFLASHFYLNSIIFHSKKTIIMNTS